MPEINKEKKNKQKTYLRILILFGILAAALILNSRARHPDAKQVISYLQEQYSDQGFRTLSMDRNGGKYRWKVKAEKQNDMVFEVFETYRFSLNVLRPKRLSDTYLPEAFSQTIRPYFSEKQYEIESSGIEYLKVVLQLNPVKMQDVEQARNGLAGFYQDWESVHPELSEKKLEIVLRADTEENYDFFYSQDQSRGNAQKAAWESIFISFNNKHYQAEKKKNGMAHLGWLDTTRSELCLTVYDRKALSELPELKEEINTRAKGFGDSYGFWKGTGGTDLQIPFDVEIDISA